MKVFSLTINEEYQSTSETNHVVVIAENEESAIKEAAFYNIQFLNPKARSIESFETNKTDVVWANWHTGQEYRADW